MKYEEICKLPENVVEEFFTDGLNARVKKIKRTIVKSKKGIEEMEYMLGKNERYGIDVLTEDEEDRLKEVIAKVHNTIEASEKQLKLYKTYSGK